MDPKSSMLVEAKVMVTFERGTIGGMGGHKNGFFGDRNSLCPDLGMGMRVERSSGPTVQPSALGCV